MLHLQYSIVCHLTSSGPDWNFEWERLLGGSGGVVLGLVLIEIWVGIFVCLFLGFAWLGLAG